VSEAPEVSTLPDGLWFQPEVDTTSISALDGVEPVRSIRTPASLTYRYTPGIAQSRFLKGMAEGRIMGERCPVCEKVYVPSRGACPVDGVPTVDPVEVADRGTVVSYCIVNVEFTGRGFDLPYASALVLPDGADVPLFGLIQETSHENVHVGLRVEAKWKPEDEWTQSLENIEWWRPSGEDDADPETYKELV
jgi:uncharacterized OB-fold protein